MILAVQVQAQSFLTNGLVAYYPFNGNANDGSGNGNNGTLVGATLTANHLGIANSAYSFNGSNSYIYATVTNLPFGNSPRSISGWIKIYSNTSQFANFVASWGYGDWNPADCYAASFGLYIDNIVTTLAFWGSFVGMGANYDFHTNTFYSVAATYDGNGNVALYVNGAYLTEQNVGNLNTVTNNSLLRIGRSTHTDTTGWAGYLTGSLDNVRIYNRALSASEVQQLYVYESGPEVDLIKSVKPSFKKLTLTTNYQMQISADMSTWTNYGAAFTATNTSMVYPQYWDVDNWNSLYFRLQVAP